MMYIIKVSFIFILSLVLISCDKKINTKGINNSYISIQGENVKLHQSNKKYTIVNYWATWCAPCREEIVEFNNFIKNNNNSVNIIGITLEPLEHDTLKTVLENLSVNYPIVTDDIMNDLFAIETEVFPTTYIIKSQGEIIKVINGPVTSKQLEEYTS